MERGGWVKVSRQLMEHWVWTQERFSMGQAWVDLLLMVGFQDSKLLLDGKLMTVPRGSVITSQVKLARRWKWKRDKVRHFLELLEGDGMIRFHCTDRYTSITLVRYAAYQDRAGEGAWGAKEIPVCPAGMGAAAGAGSGAQNKKTEEPIRMEKKEERAMAVFALYGELCPSLPAAQVTEGRLREARKLWEAAGPAGVRNYFARAQASSFLTGRNARGWRADLDWLMRPGSLEKVLSGRYDDRGHDGRARAAEEMDAFYAMAKEWGKG